ncbi:DMT family transporter [Poseidonibacter lekithochrous]|uniref:DMT family transporter n=1 Tax=Poseidonibacter lekithochrous TaxID=1904463 RepID=UPI0008FCD38C|nr:DMT family transporter [Poseidonibacter lekithochrous]QKJ23657.1 EamA/RhaT family transporter [Poseidonibacter lekithochrous]
MKNNTYIFALLITMLGVVLMSVETLLIKMTNISGLTYSFYIGILMFISLNAVLLKDGIKNTINIYKDNLRIILISGLLMGLANMFFINSVKHTSIANAVIIISSAPLFATLFAYLFYKEKPQKNIFIASIFIFIGLIIIFSKQISSGNLFGDFLALLCAMSFSLNFVVMSKHTSVNRFAVLAFAGVCITLMSLLFIQSYTVDTTSMYILLIAGLLISPFSRIFVLIGTKTLPASEISLLTILETILAPIWAWIFISEIPVSTTIFGGLVILATLIINSLYLIKISKKKALI